MNTKQIALPSVVVIAVLLAFSTLAAAAGIGGYAGDNPLVTYEQDVIHGGIVFVTDETGNIYTPLNTTYYRTDPGFGQPSEFWDNLTQTMEITGIPEGATIKTARLYNYYTWSTSDWDLKVPGMPAEADIWFNGEKRVCQHGLADGLDNRSLLANPIPYKKGVVQYWDTKGQNYASKTYDYPSGTFAWDVTSMVTGNGVYVAKITNHDSTPTGIRPGQSDPIDPRRRERFATYGFGLLVVYEHPDSPKIEYWIDEGRDILYSRYGETPLTATTSAPFDGSAKWGNPDATLTTVLTASDEWYKTPPENMVCFNCPTCSDCPDNELGPSTAANYKAIAVDNFNVEDQLMHKDNCASFQSRDDYEGVCNAFLVVEKP